MSYNDVLCMPPERKLLTYNYIGDDERILTIGIQDYTGPVWVCYQNAILDEGDVKSDKIYKKVSKEYFEESFDRGRGNTIQEALEDYVDFLQGKTVCFATDQGEEYLVTFDFLDPANFETEDSDTDDPDE